MPVQRRDVVHKIFRQGNVNHTINQSYITSFPRLRRYACWFSIVTWSTSFSTTATSTIHPHQPRMKSLRTSHAPNQPIDEPHHCSGCGVMHASSAPRRGPRVPRAFCTAATLTNQSVNKMANQSNQQGVDGIPNSFGLGNTSIIL